MAKKRNTEVVVQEGEDKLPLEILQFEIQKLANVGRQMNHSRLKQKTIILLLHDITKVPKKHIQYILNSISDLEEDFLKPNI